jgi:hypothetical protein
MPSFSREQCLALAVNESISSAAPAHEVFCWHCCHPFTGASIPLPIAYNDRSQVWKTTGAFCSWECAKAWNWDSGAGYRSGLRGQLLTLLRKRVTGTLSRTISAPPRAALAVFGGTLSIQEFRAKASAGIIVEMLPEKMVPLECIIHERKVEAKRASTAAGPNLSEGVDFASSTQKNETLRLKRSKPMPSTTDVLARTMGLEISNR